MVHTLRELHRITRPGGALLDLRPAVGDREIAIINGDDIRALGYVNSSATLDDKLAADASVKTVVDANLFVLDKQGQFDLHLYCDTFGDLEQYASTMEKSFIPDATLKIVEQEMAQLTEASIRLHFEMQIARYARR